MTQICQPIKRNDQAVLTVSIFPTCLADMHYTTFKYKVVHALFLTISGMT